MSAPRAIVPVEGVYLIELHDGSIKLGRSADIAARLRVHADALVAYGLRATSVWSHAVPDSALAEKLMKRMFAGLEGAHPIGSSREMWAGLSMAEAMMTTLAVLKDPSLFTLAEPVGVDLRSGEESHLRDDVQRVMGHHKQLHSADLLGALKALRPEHYGSWDVLVLSMAMRRELNLRSKDMRVGSSVRKGYTSAALASASRAAS